MRTLEEAARCLRKGGIVIYPTETFMALGCRVGDEKAALRLYAAKERALSLPLPVIGSDREQVERIAHIPPEAEDLIACFWPGPLSILLPARPSVPPVVDGGSGHVAVRISSHPGACALASAVGEALVASSANISGRPAASAAGQVDAALLARTDGIFEVSPKPEGLAPSTLVRVTGRRILRILRAGRVETEALRRAGFTAEGPDV